MPDYLCDYNITKIRSLPNYYGSPSHPTKLHHFNQHIQFFPNHLIIQSFCTSCNNLSCYFHMQTPLQQNSSSSSPSLNLQLITPDYYQYQHSPERYIFELIQQNNPWPHEPEHKIMQFLQSISKLYNNISYHNLTHAFDVMTSFDLYLTRYGWMERLQITHHKRIFMLVAAYAHDSGHEGLTNAYYKNIKHPLSLSTVSPLQTMHASNLKKLLREFQLEIPKEVQEGLVEMILKTDNFYHGWLVEKLEALKSVPNGDLSPPEHAQNISCVLLHAADLNNAAKDFELSIRWTNQLYIQFQRQADLQRKEGLPVTFVKPASQLEFIDSNIFFLDHMIIPLFKGIAILEERSEQVFQRILTNKQHWLALKQNEQKKKNSGAE